jgi:6-phosphogluconolactonase/glucosamine-6-phosphate isomerase/deaminase
MGLYDEFMFRPASFLPHKDLPLEELERIRNIKREDMEYTNENGYSVKVVLDPTFCMVMDLFHRISESDRLDKHLTIICPNQWPGAYSAVAEMLNKFNISARNVDAFAMDEWADQDGNVAPLTYGAGLGYSFVNHFYKNIREDLRPDISHWHTFNNENKADGVYSKMIEDLGGADVIYSATGWPGHTAFIDPNSDRFKADSLEEFCKIKSGIVTEDPLTVCENSLFAPMGASGDVWAVPPKAATIGPYDVVNAKERVEVHNFSNPGGDSWQRMVSRLELYGPISPQCPASIMRLGKGICYVSTAIAAPFGSWSFGWQPDK